MRSVKPLFIFLTLAASLLSWAKSATAQSGSGNTDSSSSGMISGRVVNENGQAMPNIPVFVRASIPLTQPRTAITDNEGSFQVIGLEPSVYAVSAMAPGYVPQPRERDSEPSYYRVGESVTLRLVKGGVITGVVTSASGEPVVGITVRAMLIRDGNGQPPRYGTFWSQKSTDDRGIYRLYSLPSGTYVVSAGGRGGYSFGSNAYDTDAPTYSPSSTRDTATEIVVRSGEETSAVDIRYRGEAGHIVSGNVIGPVAPSQSYSTQVNLTQIVNGYAQGNSYSLQDPTKGGFTFYGVAPGDYDLTAQCVIAPGETLFTAPRRVTIKDSDVTGIELTAKPLGSISGHIGFEPSSAPECKNKRQPLLAEMLVTARRVENQADKDQPRTYGFSGQQGTPNKAGDFLLRNVAPGAYSLNARFFAKYWYLQSVRLQTPSTQRVTSRTASSNRVAGLSQNWIDVKTGERVAGVTITLAEGAASLRGSIQLPEGDKIPPLLSLYLVPAEKDKNNDELRFFSVPIGEDASFAIGNLPPGRYWLLTRINADYTARMVPSLRSPEQAPARAKLSAEAEAAHTEIELMPCQNATDYRLPLKLH